MIRTSASVVLSSVAAAAAKSLISAMRDDDDEKKEKDESGKTVTVGVRGFGQKYLEAFLPNLLDNATGLLPLVGNWLGSFITGETYNSSSMDSALLDSITRMWQALGKGDYEMAWYRGLQVVSNATGWALGTLTGTARRCLPRWSRRCSGIPWRGRHGTRASLLPRGCRRPRRTMSTPSRRATAGGQAGGIL